jgi:hypothetical protein
MLDLDKFYTPSEVSKNCIDLTIKTLMGRLVIAEFFEPSAGKGSFSNQINGCVAVDILPEAEGIIQADFLKMKIKYKKGRVMIGNPPFGKRNNLARSFYKKSVEIADAIAFILPISQLNNNDSLFDFDLIESVDLGILEYSGLKVHCCFNVYIRPENGVNKKPKVKTELFEIFRDDYPNYGNIKEDLCVHRRGRSSGKEKLTNKHKHSYKIVVKDKDNVDFVRNKILGFDWTNFKKHQSEKSISKNDINRLFTN